MFDDRFVSALATELAAKLIPQIEQGHTRQRPTARLLTVKEAAAYIGRSEQAVQHMIHKRELVVVRKGRRVHLTEATSTAGSRAIRYDSVTGDHVVRWAMIYNRNV